MQLLYNEPTSFTDTFITKHLLDVLYRYIHLTRLELLRNLFNNIRHLSGGLSGFGDIVREIDHIFVLEDTFKTFVSD